MAKIQPIQTFASGRGQGRGPEARLYRVGPAHLTRPGAWVPGLALGTRGSYWFNSADFISFSKKFTCWVLKGPTGQRSHGKAACRGVGVGEGGNITVSDSI